MNTCAYDLSAGASPSFNQIAASSSLLLERLVSRAQLLFHQVDGGYYGGLVALEGYG